MYTAIIVLIRFLSQSYDSYWGMQWLFKHQGLPDLLSNWTNNRMRNVDPLEVVSRGSDTQLQVGKNLGI